jgi:hypothetical protein
MAGYPFRFYFRDYDLQGQESETFVVRFSDPSLDAALSDDDGLVDELAEFLKATSVSSLSGVYGISKGLACMTLFYERNDDDEIDYAAFDQAADELFRILDRHRPIAEVIHVGGHSSGDAWERHSWAQGDPTPTRLRLIVNDLGYSNSVFAPADLEDFPEPVTLRPDRALHSKLAQR